METSRECSISTCIKRKMGIIKDKNGSDLVDAEEIKRWKEYMEELYQKRSK